MLKSVENLIVANNEGRKSAKQGNHYFERVGNIAKFLIIFLLFLIHYKGQPPF